ncbi:MAG TPA: hypothetical protein VGI39_16530 [Polyangiaceae bacterium]|jgi:hypothetical protein
MRLVWLVWPCSVAACGIAFGPAAPATHVPTQGALTDTQDSQAEERREDDAHLKAAEPTLKQEMPAMGVSVVVGGTPLDAGPLPKPPIPIVKP